MRVKGITAHQKIAPAKLQRARQLRRGMTPAENTLWQELRRGRLGVHFRRQQIVAGFIVDFFCDEASLVIELDGGMHRRREQIEQDADRAHKLREMGLRVLRFTNEDVLQDLPRVLRRIRSLAQA